MTHKEMVDAFIAQNLKEGDIVKIEFVTGEVIIRMLYWSKVGCDIDDNGEKINSRIAILPPPGKVYENIPPYPISSKYIKNITKVLQP